MVAEGAKDTFLQQGIVVQWCRRSSLHLQCQEVHVSGKLLQAGAHWSAQRPHLSSGGCFAGGTLARADQAAVVTLPQLCKQVQQCLPPARSLLVSHE